MSDAPVLDAAALARLERIGGAGLLRRMVALYLEHGPDRVAELLGGARAGELARVERAAHTLKSSAGNLGAARLQRSAEALEAMVVDGGLDDELVRQVARDYEESVVELKRALESRA